MSTTEMNQLAIERKRTNTHAYATAKGWIYERLKYCSVYISVQNTQKSSSRTSSLTHSDTPLVNKKI